MLQQRSINRGIGFAIAAAFCWGIATVMSKGALNHFPPITLLAIQLGASVCALWAGACVYHRQSVSLKDASRFSWLGLLEPGLAYLFGLTGLSETTSSEATLITSLEAIFIAGLSFIFFKEGLHRWFAVLSLVSLAGLLLALGKGFDSSHRLNFQGDFLITLGVALAAVYVVLSARVATRIPAIVLVAYQQSLALAFALALLPLQGLLPAADAVPSLEIRDILLAVLSGIVQYALAFTFYMVALRQIPTSLAGNFLNLSPLVGLVGAWLFLGDRLSAMQWFGAAMTLAATAMITRLPRVDERPGS